MDRRSIVLKSISCRGVKSFNLFQKPSTRAVVSIVAGNDGRLKQKQKQKTSADHEGGENPEWNQKIQFDFDDSDFQDLFLEFAIMAQGNLLVFGDKLIGKARVPITDLSIGHPFDVVRHVSYQVRSPDGKPNGVLSFSYSVNLPEMEIRIPPPLDQGIPSEPAMDDYTPPPAQPTKSLYPPLPLPEAEPEDCFCYYNQPLPPDPPKYYNPPPDPPKDYYPPPDPPKHYYPPPPASGYYPAFDRADSSPAFSRDAYLPVPVIANGGYYTPPTASIQPPMPAFGTYYPSSAPSYTYPPSQGSCSYCNWSLSVEQSDESRVPSATPRFSSCIMSTKQIKNRDHAYLPPSENPSSFRTLSALPEQLNTRNS